MLDGMEATMHNNWLNHLIVLNMYQQEIEKNDIRKTANEFIIRNDSEDERFTLL